LLHRRPAAVFVDEAQHLARMASGRKLSDQLDVIKSIANRTQTVHVLVGTYELLAFRNLSGQLSRRSIDVHFRRYDAENPDDVQVFKNVLLTFQNQLPLPELADLMDFWDFVYERSVGCVGILKDWLVRALTMALLEGQNVLRRKYLEATALSASQCEKILAEAREGEARLTETAESRSRLRHLLGLSTPSIRTDEPPGCPGQLKPSTRKGRCVHRRPKRDPIGNGLPAYA
jgi:hypothetical protein